MRHRAGAGWRCYSPYTRKQISERKYQTSRDLPRQVRLMNHATSFDHDVKIPVWKEDCGDGGVRYGRSGGEEPGLSQTVECDNADVGRALFYDNYGNAPMTVGYQRDGNVKRTVIICKFLLDVRLP